MIMGEPNEDLQYFLKLQKQRSNDKKEKEDDLVQGKKKTLRPLYFQISYLPHFLLVLNNLKSYESANRRFTNPFSNKDNRATSKNFKT
jgi:hypothetical protein